MHCTNCHNGIEYICGLSGKKIGPEEDYLMIRMNKSETITDRVRHTAWWRSDVVISHTDNWEEYYTVLTEEYLKYRHSFKFYLPYILSVIIFVLSSVIYTLSYISLWKEPIDMMQCQFEMLSITAQEYDSFMTDIRNHIYCSWIVCAIGSIGLLYILNRTFRPDITDESRVKYEDAELYLKNKRPDILDSMTRLQATGHTWLAKRKRDSAFYSW